jgi:hypothetical protein
VCDTLKEELLLLPNSGVASNTPSTQRMRSRNVSHEGVRRLDPVGVSDRGHDLPEAVAPPHGEELSARLVRPQRRAFEYSAVASNLSLTIRNLWHFMGGRGNHDKTIGHLKTGLAFHTVPTNAYAANSAWQQLVAVTHNLLANFQMDTVATPRTQSRKHTVLHLLTPCRRSGLKCFIARRCSWVRTALYDCD